MDPELFVSGPQPVARGVARPRGHSGLYILLSPSADARGADLEEISAISVRRSAMYFGA